MRGALTCSLLLLLLSTGCGTRPAPTAAVEQPSGPPVTGRVTPPVPADKSLTPEEYIRLGMPAHDRVWLGPDMAQAEKVLAPLAVSEARLPRYQSDRSGAVFSRMTAAQNLKGLQDRAVPISTRLPLALIYFQSINQIFKHYSRAFDKGEVRDSDVVELMGAMLKTTVVLLDLIDEFFATLDKDDPTYPVRMRAQDGIRVGLGGVVIGSLITLTERDSYRTSELVRLVGYMEETLPQLVTRLPPGSRAEVIMKLKSMQTNPSLADLQPGLARVHANVMSAIDANTPP
jgi:hypothetical protein